MRIRRLTPLLLAALLLAGCGGSSAPKVSPGDIAVVGSQQITLAAYKLQLVEERANLKSQGEAFPAAGSTNYQSMETSIIDALVEQAEFEIEAQKRGIVVTTAQVNKELATIVKAKPFDGNEAKYQSELKKAGYTDAELDASVRQQLRDNALFAQIVKNVKPTAAEIRATYQEDISTYETPATRPVEEILVGKKKQSLAEQIEAELKAGTKTFAQLAKKYSQDPGTKNSGGIYTASQGRDVAQFDAAVFSKSATIGELLPPVNTTEYGWFVIKILGAIKPKTTESEAKEAPSIAKTLTTNEQQAALTTWFDGVEKGFCNDGSMVFAAGYTPSPTPCSTLTATNQTTT